VKSSSRIAGRLCGFCGKGVLTAEETEEEEVWPQEGTKSASEMGNADAIGEFENDSLLRLLRFFAGTALPSLHC
jgi:hypothetical protein